MRWGGHGGARDSSAAAPRCSSSGAGDVTSRGDEGARFGVDGGVSGGAASTACASTACASAASAAAAVAAAVDESQIV